MKSTTFFAESNDLDIKDTYTPKRIRCQSHYQVDNLLQDKDHEMQQSEQDHHQVNAQIDVNQLMQQEQQRRVEEMSNFRCAKAKQMIIQKTQEIWIEEINKMRPQLVKSIENSMQNIQNLEDQYKQSLRDISSYNTPQKEENQPIQLREQPQPLPKKPDQQLQFNDIFEQDIIQLKTKQHMKGKKESSQKQKDKKQQQRTTQQRQALFKTNYRNNFNKDSNLIEKLQKEQYHSGIRENLSNQIYQLVQEYEEGNQENQKIEDMILELHRTAIKTNGCIPNDKQAKVNQVVGEIEMQKLNYMSRQSLSPSSPSQSQSQIQTQLKPSRYSQKDINVNSQELRSILSKTKSKVSNQISGIQSKFASTQAHSQRQSIDIRQPDYRSRNNTNEHEIQGLMVEFNLIIKQISARVLSSFLNRKANSLLNGDYEIAYLFTLLISMVDQQIPLNNDKSDLQRKSWEDLQRQLSNYGRVTYQLQKFKGVVEHIEKLNQSLTEMNFSAKAKDLSEFTQQIHSSAIPFLNLILIVYKLYEQSKSSKPNKNLDKKQNFQKYLTPSSENKNITTPRNQMSVHNKIISKAKQRLSSTCRKENRFSEMVNIKRESINKLYDTEVKKSIEIREKEMQAKKKQFELIVLQSECNRISKQIEKEDKESLIQCKKKDDQEYMKYQTEFRSRLRSVSQKERDEKRKSLREKSLEDQKFQREVSQKIRQQQQEQEREELQKTIEESKWKQQQEQKLRKEFKKEIVQKEQKINEDRLLKTQRFVIQKEQEVDERINEKFQQANSRLKELERQERSIKEEMEILLRLRESKKKIY